MRIQQITTWQDAKANNQYPQLKENINVDVAIVGGGITGITSAYMLAKAGKKVALVESKKYLASDTTLFTTAFITKVIDTGLSDLIKMFGEKNTKLIWESGQQAIDQIEQIVKAEKIDCDFKRVSYFTYANEDSQFQSLEEEQAAAKKVDQEVTLKKKNSFKFKNAGYLEVKNQAKFNPIKYVETLAEKAVANGVQIFTSTEVTAISGHKSVRIKTKNYEIKANQVIIATYKPIKVLKTFAKKGMYQSYVFEVKLPQNLILEGLYVDLENPYHYFRIDKEKGFDRMIIGGEDHREEAKMSATKNFKALEAYLKNLIAVDYQITRKWTGPILEPSDGIALIGESKPNQFVATAFSGNGMTYSTIAGMIFRDAITGKKNPWSKLYDPTRKMKLKAFGRKALDYGEEFYQGYVKNNLKY
ncbi:MAG: Iron-sulfur cluster-binding protein Rieske family [Candidatus Doudnabacteria bacterium]|nr:Iron-sulfur cluster-binding protein Rieske family [Candidatus Doudnabacteria bacterium]